MTKPADLYAASSIEAKLAELPDAIAKIRREGWGDDTSDAPRRTNTGRAALTPQQREDAEDLA